MPRWIASEVIPNAFEMIVDVIKFEFLRNIRFYIYSVHWSEYLFIRNELNVRAFVIFFYVFVI